MPSSVKVEASKGSIKLADYDTDAKELIKNLRTSELSKSNALNKCVAKIETHNALPKAKD